ncbi:MAG: hypothetical protein ACREX7_00350 [Casimicrobiaceae bacterium]
MRYLLTMCLLLFAAQARADGWLDDDISDMLSKVRSIYSEVTGDVKDAAQDLVRQLQQRSVTMTETVDDLLTWSEQRRTPFLDFVNGGSERCGQGSPCWQFRADLKAFALDVASLKDRFPVIEQNGLGDTTLFADATDILPPFVLFGLYEILSRTPDWQELPTDLVDLFDEIGDPEVFSVDMAPPASAAVASGKARALRASGSPYFGSPMTPADTFCSKGKEPLVDDVRLNRLKGLLTRWKNRFDSLSEYPPDEAMLDLAGEGGGALKIPTKPFLKTVSNAIDSIVNMTDTYRANLDTCQKIETDVAQSAPLVEYRTMAGNRKAYWVVVGVMNRSSLIGTDKTTAKSLLAQAGKDYAASDWKRAYADICAAYSAL